MKRVLLATAFAVAFAAGGALIWVRQASDDPLSRLRSSRRVNDARLSAFEYGPLRSQSMMTSDYTVLAELYEEAGRVRTAANVHRLALGELVLGRTSAAQQLLLEARTLRPDDPAILSDLAAAEISLGRFADAAELSGRALRLDPKNQAAAFNWALAVERLSIRPIAIEAWEKYLLLDGQSGWAHEARQHLARLRQPRVAYEQERERLRPGADRATIERIVRRFPQRSRARVQNIILPRWVESGNDADFALMHTIAEVRAAIGDPYLLDIVNHAAQNRDAIAPGIQAFTAGRAEQEKTDWLAAGKRFSEASELLSRAGSPLAIGAEIYAAQGDYTNGKGAAALARLDRVDRQLDKLGHRYPVMATESAWVRALTENRYGNSQKALDVYRYALEQAKRSGEIEHVAAVEGLISWVLETIGDPAEADRYRLAALRHNDDINAAPDRMYVSYLDTAFVALRSGRPHLALAFVDALSRIAQRSAVPLWMAESDSWRALGQLQLGQRDAAAASIASARRHAQRIGTTTLRDFTVATIDYASGRIEITNPKRAAEAFSAALETWNRYGWRLHSANALLARGDAFLLAGDPVNAERDFRAGITEIEHQRVNLEEPAVRIAFFERADNLFDRLIHLLIQQERTIDALSIVERKRARLLLDHIATPAGSMAAPLDGKAIAARVGGNQVILELLLTDRAAEIWLIGVGRIIHQQSPAPRRQIETTVAEHLAAIAAGDENALKRSGRWLYNQLIAPVATSIPSDADLVIVPDGVLHSFPFGTLMTDRGAYLIDERVLTTAPSASVFLQSPKESRDNTLLAVAQPAPRGLQALPNVASEAAEVAHRHERGRLLTGTEITPEEFLIAASSAGVVHFGGHATSEPDEPARSRLLFESRNGAPSELTAQTIARSRMRGHPLVVLAACGTARGKLRRTEGMDSLASAFLQSGARGVTATLWDIDDTVSSRLFRTFHQNLRSGERASDALRNAQRSLLHGNDPRERQPAVWASVTLIGTL